MEAQVLISVPLPEFLAAVRQTVSDVLAQKTFDDEKPLTSQEVEEFFGISSTTLQKWRNKNKIPFTRVENKIFYNRADVMQAIKNVA